MKPTTIVTRVMAALAVALVGFATFAVFAPAQAESPPPPRTAASAQGKTTAKLAIRQSASVYSTKVGGLARGSNIKIDCKVAGTSVAGNYRWYALTGRKGWVSAKYVDNVGRAPVSCPQMATEYGVGKAKAPLNKRYAPTLKDGKRGTIATGTQFRVRCHARGASVDGNNMWYYLNSGAWVSAKHVQRVKTDGPSNWAPCRM